MSTTGIRSMDREINVAMEWIIDFDEELGWDDRQKSFQAVRATFHALRDRLTPDEAANLAAELPTFLRGVYYEGYKPARTPVKMRKPEEFYDRIREKFKQQPIVDSARLASCVFAVLSRRIAEGEIEDLKGMLSENLHHLWTSGRGPGAEQPRPG